MSAAPPIPVFDGHNDVLLSLHLPERGGGRSFFARGDRGHLDLPRAREGGFAGGFFAIFAPSPEAEAEPVETAEGYTFPQPPPLEYAEARQATDAMLARLVALARQSAGQLRVVCGVEEIEACLRDGVIAAVVHLEGAEAIDRDLETLDGYYRAGLRSLGVVWSRPNAFGYGVPYDFPSSPDTGPGLTGAGERLVRACNAMGILVDLAHLNERGFWDVARVSDAPLVVTHAGVHALAPVARNLTDRQLDALRDTGGVIGIAFDVWMLRDDGVPETDTPVDRIAEHVLYVADRIGIEHVALGSDFDGCRLPRALGDVTGLPRLLNALRARGCDDAALRQIAHANWLRVLRQTWRPVL